MIVLLYLFIGPVAASQSDFTESFCSQDDCYIKSLNSKGKCLDNKKPLNNLDFHTADIGIVSILCIYSPDILQVKGELTLPISIVYL